MQQLRDLCSENGILLVADEVQSRFGCKGKHFASEHFGIAPDMMTVVKGIASGLPISSAFARSDLAAKWAPGSHGGTYGGNAVACASAIATIKVIQEEGLLHNVTERGIQLRACLKELQVKYQVMGDVRGLGLMDAVGFTKNDQPDADTTKAVMAACLEGSSILLTCGTFDNIIQWIPPLVITKDEIDQGVDIFAAALRKAA